MTRARRRRNVAAQLLALVPLLGGIGLGSAGATNALGAADLEGRELVRQILELRPTGNFTNSGVVHIRDAKRTQTTMPLRCDLVVTATNWFTVYELRGTNAWLSRLLIAHDAPASNRYELTVNCGHDPLRAGSQTQAEVFLHRPFAGDFWVADLGLEFFRWPAQKVLKHEMKRGQACKVLESTNPAPPTNGYSRVVSWIDNDTLGIVQAEAYDARGRLLKQFFPREFKKVNGQWQVRELEIRNVQTGSRTRLEFNLENR